MDDILGEIYVPSRYSQNILTSVSWNVCSVGEEHPDTLRVMKNLAAIQKAMSQSMKVDNAQNQVHKSSCEVPATQGMEGENVDTGVPYASHRVLGDNNSDAAGAPASFTPTTNMNNRMIHSQNKSIYLAYFLVLPIFDAYVLRSLFFQNLEENFKT